MATLKILLIVGLNTREGSAFQLEITNLGVAVV